MRFIIYNIGDHAPSPRQPAAFGFPIVRISHERALPPLARPRARVLPRLSYRSRLFCPSVRQCTLNVDDSGRCDNEGKKERNGERERERERCYRYLHRFTAALALSKPELARKRARLPARPRELLQLCGKTSWSDLCARPSSSNLLGCDHYCDKYL